MYNITYTDSGFAVGDIVRFKGQKTNFEVVDVTVFSLRIRGAGANSVKNGWHPEFKFELVKSGTSSAPPKERSTIGRYVVLNVDGQIKPVLSFDTIELAEQWINETMTDSKDVFFFIVKVEKKLKRKVSFA